MSNFKIRQYGDLILREKCEEVKTITSDVLSNLDNMTRVMEDKEGIGLAAPQVGFLSRYIVMFNPDTKEIIRMINPKITFKSEKKVTREEGCLSILDKITGLPVYAEVTRPESIIVEWMDKEGELLSAKMIDLASRIVQHEVDHLDGILFIDYLSPVKREMLLRKVRKFKQ